ncbi:MAG TPA: hypothetical protein VKM55_25275 [Candidatus Lokiarchaeia archaeon]|nr:hypothetical protein [Candidatus Lokiarchaeia archaeon]
MRMKKPITLAFMIFLAAFTCCPVARGTSNPGIPASVVQHQHVFTTGWYPRMLQLGNALLVAYFNGSVVLGGVNLTTGVVNPPKTIIPGGDRPMLLHDPVARRVMCVFNYNGYGNGAGIGIAYANDTQWQNTGAWVIQHGLVGPIVQANDLIGVWEPYIASFDDATGRFLLFFSNQTSFNASRPIDDGGYYFTQEGFAVNQQIDVKWMTWNGTGFVSSDAGVVSNDIDGKNIHYKDGMASAVLVDETAMSKSFIVTFESFPRGQPSSIAAVRITVSLSAGVVSEWRRVVTNDNSVAPFIARWKDGYAVSYRHDFETPKEVLGLVGVSSDGVAISLPVHAVDCPSVWPSLYTLDNGSLWVAGGSNTTSNLIIAAQIAPSFQWLQTIPLMAATCPIIIVAIAGIVMVCNAGIARRKIAE